MPEIDYEYIGRQLTELVEQTLLKKEIETQNFIVKVDLPIQLVKVLTHLAAATESDLYSFVSRAAERGIRSYIDQMKSPAPAAPEVPEMPGEIAGKLNELKEVMNRLGGMAEQVKALEEGLSKSEIDHMTSLNKEEKDVSGDS